MIVVVDRLLIVELAWRKLHPEDPDHRERRLQWLADERERNGRD